MASPRSFATRSEGYSERRYRRSSFNGAKQLSAVQAPRRRMLALLALLALALVGILAVIVGLHLSADSTPQPFAPAATAPATHPASH